MILIRQPMSRRHNQGPGGGPRVHWGLRSRCLRSAAIPRRCRSAAAVACALIVVRRGHKLEFGGARDKTSGARDKASGSGLTRALKGTGSDLGFYDEVCVGPSSAPRMYIVFVPGNPGQPGYYRTYANLISERLGAHVTLLAWLGTSP